MKIAGLILLLLPGVLWAVQNPADFRRAYLKRSWAHQEARSAYAQSAQVYQQHVMGTGSTLGDEAERLKRDMEAMRLRSDQMRRDLSNLGPVPLSSATLRRLSSLRVSPELRQAVAARRSKKLKWTLWPAFVGAGLLILAAVRIVRATPRKKARVKCPGCGQVLSLLKRRRRVTFKCPKCGRKSAYNPKI